MGGVCIGAGIGYGAIALINALAPRTPIAVPALPVPWLLGGFSVGVAVTLVASWLPIRSAGQASPLKALRSSGVMDANTANGTKRLVLSALTLAVGLVLLSESIAQASRVLMLIGGVAFCVGVLLFGPVLVPRLIRIAGAPFGYVGWLAAVNATRNPRHTAANTAALLTSVILISAMLTGMVTWRSAMGEHRNMRLPIDIALTSLDGPISGGVLDQVRQQSGVEQAVAVEGAIGHISGWEAPIPIVAATTVTQVAHDGGAFARAEPGTIRLDHDAFHSVDRELRFSSDGHVTVQVGGRQVRLKAVLLDGWGQTAVVAPETLAQLTATPQAQVIWVRAAAGADRIRLVDHLDELARDSGLEISDRLQVRAAGDRQIDILIWSVLGLLGISVGIAVFGVANTLALSMLERAREHALLRALGLTQAQLRKMLAAESALQSMIAILLGTGIGIGLAWVAYRAVIKPALGQAILQVPWIQLSAVVFLIVSAGWLATIFPARRASRVSSAAELSLD